MLRVVTLLGLVAFCLSQQIAREKCTEYAVRAKSHTDSPLCKALTDEKTGVKIEPKEFPATAVLGYVAPSGEVLYLCDATLISEDTLLSAGHCLRQKQFGTPKYARVGVTSTSLGAEVEVTQSICHPQYHPGHDIAVVKLKDRLNSSFIPACLDTDGVVEGTRGVGVGRPVGSAYVELRRKCPVKAWLEVRPSQECINTFPNQNISKEAILCTRDPSNGPGDCLSGPLYISRQSCVQTVVGIASFGKPCLSEDAASRSASVYTRVSHYMPWIESVTWPSSSPTTSI